MRKNLRDASLCADVMKKVVVHTELEGRAQRYVRFQILDHHREVVVWGGVPWNHDWIPRWCGCRGGQRRDHQLGRTVGDDPNVDELRPSGNERPDPRSAAKEVEIAACPSVQDDVTRRSVV